MTGFRRSITALLILTAGCLAWNRAQAQLVSDRSEDLPARSEFIFPLQEKHVHSSSLVELPNGGLLACWFEGSGERNADDVAVKGARLNKGASHWSPVFILADTPDFPDCNPTLFIDKDKRLHLFWTVVVANRWESSILKTRVSSNYQASGAPEWEWQDIILLKPREAFAGAIETGFRKCIPRELAWAEYAPPYERMITEAARDPKKRQSGWMTRTHPLQLPDGRILLPLYSDGFNLSLIAISDDRGQSWEAALPIVGRGNIQPSLVLKENGDLQAFMRDNGDAPGRIQQSVSRDKGFEWSVAKQTSLPNPGASVEALSLENGDWILVYNDIENGRHSLAVSLSENEGESWDWTRQLERSGPGEGSYSYPSVIQAKDGTIHVSYSFHTGAGKTIKHLAFPPEWIKNK